MVSVTKEVACVCAVSVAVAVLAGAFCIIIQQMQAIPLLIDAEAYEVEEEHATPVAEEEEWFPADGAPRHLCTFVSNVFVMWGYSLIMLGFLVFRHQPIGGLKGVLDYRASLWGGLCWGCVGFAVFGLAPGLNLPPELPGMVAAELQPRQGCWGLTASFTTAGFVLLFIGEPKLGLKLLAYFFGIVCLFIPQLIGAPDHVHEDGSGARPPPELAAKFTIAALISQAISWIFLGMVTALGYNKYYGLCYGTEESAQSVCGMLADSPPQPSVFGSNANSDGNGEAHAGDQGTL